MRLNLKSRKAKISIIMSIILVCAVIAIIAGNAVVNPEKDANTTITEILTEQTSESTTQSTTKLTNETTTQQKETETTEAKQNSDNGSGSSSRSSSQKSTSSKNSSSSGSSSSKKQTTTKKQSTTSKPKSYAMSTTEIRNYALEQIAKIDKTVYVPEFTKDNAGWSDPLEIYYEDSKSDIKRNIIDCAEAAYGRDNVDIKWYNVYVEESTDWSATISSSGELKEYYTPCIKVYFLYAFR